MYSMAIEITCPECGKKAIKHAKGLCNNCYRRIAWKQKIKKCENCGRMRPHKAYGLCSGCHMRIYHYDVIKAHQSKKLYGVDLDTYKNITKKCAVCGFDKIVELHHLDGDKANLNVKNFVGLCPNCHKQLHHYDYFKNMKKKLAEKGYDVSNIHPVGYANRRKVVKNQDTLNTFA